MRVTALHSALIAIGLSLVSAGADADADGVIIPNEYIVTLRSGIDLDAVTQHLDWLDGLLSSITNNTLLANLTAAATDELEFGVETVARVLKRWNIGHWNAYAGVFDVATAAQIGALDIVETVEPDREISADGGQEVTQVGAPWGLGTISHRESGHYDEYVFNSAAGEGTYAYVLDSGVRTTHEEFEGRATFGYDATNDSFNGDENGHGTHVAATIAGKTFGVAKKANIISVKILKGPKARGKVSQMVDGIHWAVEDIRGRGRSCVSVINISASTKLSTSLNSAVAAAAAAVTGGGGESGSILTVTAAGNCYANASAYSPASVPEALTVGAVGPDGTRAQFSNYGDAVDVFAPGVGVLSAGPRSDTDTACLDGTSMATPYVSGLALYLKSLVPERTKTPEETVRLIKYLATEGAVADTRGAPSLLVFNGHGDEKV
ncbi:peptidase S8/S53 domain-containing protein [Biscogniauxia marginata]|nr:peptidase S8/S53 domain-containing protein [Biscogniauxia marginata]